MNDTHRQGSYWHIPSDAMDSLEHSCFLLWNETMKVWEEVQCTSVLQDHPWGSCKGSCPAPGQSMTADFPPLQTIQEVPAPIHVTERLGGSVPSALQQWTMDMAQHLFVGQHWAGPWGLSAFWTRLIRHLMLDSPICIKQGEIFILFLVVYFNF